MSEEATVADGKVVVMHYTLHDGEANMLDSSAGSDPLAYLHGASNIVPGLEKALTGQSVGFKGKVEVAPVDGYGERVDVPPQAVSRKAFPPNLDLQPGMQLVAEGPDNQRVPVWVLGTQDDTVLLEAQHPLAGVTLHFDVEIVAIRDATADERSHGHPHGIDGTAGHGH